MGTSLDPVRRGVKPFAPPSGRVKESRHRGAHPIARTGRGCYGPCRNASIRTCVFKLPLPPLKPGPLRTPHGAHCALGPPHRRTWDRLKAWSNMLLTDHGVFRLLYLNRHQVTPNFWRAAQPAPGDIKAAAEAGREDDRQFARRPRIRFLALGARSLRRRRHQAGRLRRPLARRPGARDDPGRASGFSSGCNIRCWCTASRAPTGPVHGRAAICCSTKIARWTKP